MKNVLKVAMASSILALAGCATIVSDSQYPVAIKSDPTGAAFTIKNRSGKIISQGVTPQIIQLKAGAGYFKGERYQITFEKAGFKETTIELESDIDGWYLGNVALLSPLGLLIIDPLTGAMYTLPDEAVGQLPADTGKSLNVVDINKISKKQRAKLKRIK